MPKVKISEYSATANSNTDVASINIDEGCAPSGINNAIRAIMGHLKDFQQGTYGDPFNGPVNGTVGATTPSTGAFTTLSATGNVTLGDASTDTLNVGNGGLIKDASGNVGVGVTPSAWVSSWRAIQLAGTSGNSGGSIYTNAGGTTGQIGVAQNWYWNGTNNLYLTTAAASDYYQYAGTHVWRNAASGTAGNTVTFTQAMTLDASGNLLVGAGITSSINGTFCPIQALNNTANQVAYFRNSNANPSGTIVNYSGASPNNTGNEFVYCSDSTAQRASFRSNGGVANYSANNVNLSDRREKTNFAPAKSYLDVICAIPVQTFNYIDQNMEDDAGLTLGVVAQDVQSVAPELVMESNWAKDGDEPKMRLSIYQTDLQYALMKCIQEQQALITQLTARITALEGA